MSDKIIEERLRPILLSIKMIERRPTREKARAGDYPNHDSRIYMIDPAREKPTSLPKRGAYNAMGISARDNPRHPIISFIHDSDHISGANHSRWLVGQHPAHRHSSAQSMMAPFLCVLKTIKELDDYLLTQPHSIPQYTIKTQRHVAEGSGASPAV